MKKSAVGEDYWPLLYEEEGPFLDYKKEFYHPFLSFQFEWTPGITQLNWKIEKSILETELQSWLEEAGFHTIGIDEVQCEVGVYSYETNSDLSRGKLMEYYFDIKFKAGPGHFSYLTILDSQFNPSDPCLWELSEEPQFIFDFKDNEGEVRQVQTDKGRSISLGHLAASFDSAYPRNHE